MSRITEDHTWAYPQFVRIEDLAMLIGRGINVPQVNSLGYTILFDIIFFLHNFPLIKNRTGFRKTSEFLGFL